jgi:hypothetical protein
MLRSLWTRKATSLAHRHRRPYKGPTKSSVRGLLVGVGAGLCCYCSEDTTYVVPTGFGGPVVVARVADETRGANTNVIPADGILLQSGDRIAAAQVSVVTPTGSTVPIQDLHGMSWTNGTCTFYAFTFYIGSAPPEERRRQVKAAVSNAKVRACY